MASIAGAFVIALGVTLAGCVTAPGAMSPPFALPPPPGGVPISISVVDIEPEGIEPGASADITLTLETDVAAGVAGQWVFISASGDTSRLSAYPSSAWVPAGENAVTLTDAIVAASSSSPGTAAAGGDGVVTFTARSKGDTITASADLRIK